jgi:hypothetical protein
MPAFEPIAIQEWGSRNTGERVTGGGAHWRTRDYFDFGE